MANSVVKTIHVNVATVGFIKEEQEQRLPELNTIFLKECAYKNFVVYMRFSLQNTYNPEYCMRLYNLSITPCKISLTGLTLNLCEFMKGTLPHSGLFSLGAIFPEY